MAKIIVMVDKNGGVETVVKGQNGAKCTQMTADLLQKLGTVTENVPTEEYYAMEMVQQTQTQEQTQTETLYQVNRGY